MSQILVPMTLNQAGLYYASTHNYDMMLQCFETSAKRGDINALVHLGNYYYYIKNYPKMEDYWQEAIKSQHIDAMINMGIYYQYTSDYYHARLYFQMAINCGSMQAVHCLHKLNKQNKIQYILQIFKEHMRSDTAYVVV